MKKRLCKSWIELQFDSTGLQEVCKANHKLVTCCGEYKNCKYKELFKEDR